MRETSSNPARGRQDPPPSRPVRTNGRRASRPAPFLERRLGVIRSSADGKIEDTGPLNRTRMETVDTELLAAVLNFIERQNKAGKPFFVWFNSTRMHIFTHLKAESKGKTGLGLYPTGWSSTTGTSASS